MLVSVSRYYELVTPESAEDGDASERGVVYEDVEMNIRDTIRELRQGGFSELSDSHINAGTWTTAHLGVVDYRTCEERSESLHIRTLSGNELTAHQLRRIYRAAGIKRG
jgi:S-adenosylmethionine/arginine decarboxylase-like enzyme